MASWATTATLKAIFLWLWCKPLPIQLLPLKLFCWTADVTAISAGDDHTCAFTMAPPSAGGGTPMASWAKSLEMMTAWRAYNPKQYSRAGHRAGKRMSLPSQQVMSTLVRFIMTLPNAGGVTRMDSWGLAILPQAPRPKPCVSLKDEDEPKVLLTTRPTSIKAAVCRPGSSLFSCSCLTAKKNIPIP